MGAPISPGEHVSHLTGWMAGAFESALDVDRPDSQSRHRGVAPPSIPRPGSDDAPVLGVAEVGSIGDMCGVLHASANHLTSALYAVVIEASGGADVSVFASESITGGASGAADVEVFGSPADVNVSESAELRYDSLAREPGDLRSSS